MFSVLIRTTIMYLLIMVCIRLMGKKNLGEFQPGDLVSTMLISNLTSLVIEAPDLPILYSLVPILLISCYEVLSSQLARKNEKIANITQGKSMVLIENGIINQKVMYDLRFTVNDVLEAMRNKDIFYLEEVSIAIVETTGAVNIYPDSTAFQNKEKAKIPPFPLIIDGTICTENLKYVNCDEKSISNIIKKENLNMPQILLLLVDGDGNYSYTLKEDL